MLMTNEVVQLLEGEFGDSFASVSVQVTTFGPGRKRHVQHINITGASRTVVLQFITEAQCGHDFVHGAVREISQYVADGKMQVDGITREEISKRLLVQTSDPEMVLCFDGPKRNGFLPWNIRLTEFLEAGRVGDFRLHNFVALVRKWAKVEQRYGV